MSLYLDALEMNGSDIGSEENQNDEEEKAETFDHDGNEIIQDDNIRCW